MKLTVLGGGGFRVPLIFRALAADEGQPRVTEIALHDLDPNRLAVIGSVLERMAARTPNAPVVSTHHSLNQALAGASFVFTALRVGGLAGRVADERVALGLGVLGQETTGAGGLAYALRTVPVMLRIAERIRAEAPSAYVVNFTNPAGLVTEVLQQVLGDRVIGICDTPGALTRRLATALELPPERVFPDYVGLNHLGWVRRLLYDGRDVLPDLLDDPVALAGTEEGRLFGVPWLQTLGAIPSEYLYFYEFTRDAIRSIRDRHATRGEFLRGQQDRFYDAARREPASAERLWWAAYRERNVTHLAEVGTRAPGERAVLDEAGYEAVAVAVLAGIARNEGSRMIVNVRNGSALPGLDEKAVVELPAYLDAAGAHPLATPPPEPYQLGLLQQVKAVERTIVEAAVTGSRDLAVRAFALHPLVDSVTVARALVDAYVATIPEVATVFGR